MGKDRGWEYLNSSGEDFDYDRDNDGSWGYENEDGSGSFYGNDGSWGYKNADGSASYYGADGSWGYKNADGSSSYYGNDGSWGYKNADGSGSYYGSDNESEYSDADDSDDEIDKESPGYLLGEAIGMSICQALFGPINDSSDDIYDDSSDDTYDDSYDNTYDYSSNDTYNYEEDDNEIRNRQARENIYRSIQQQQLKKTRTCKRGWWYRFTQKVKQFFITVVVIAALCGIGFLGFKYWEYKKGIEVGFSSKSIIGMNYEEAMEWFGTSGFTNVHPNPVYDLGIEDIAQEYTVASVMIHNETEFSSSDKFPYDSYVEISYHVVQNINTPISAKNCKNMNYEDLLSMFKEAGFVNITVVAEHDLVTGWITKDGSVKEIRINDNAKFSENEAFRPDAEIIITYHTF